MAEVVARVAEAAGGRLNLLLTDGHRIVATAWGVSLCWRPLAEGTLVASEPYDDDPAWVDIPDQQLLVADADGVSLDHL